MKTKISTLLVGICCSTSVLMTGCIEETFPTSVATADQLASSAKATEALLWAMPAYFNKIQVQGTSHWDWGYGSLMHIRDVMTEDMAVISSGYDWYSTWANNKSQDENKAIAQFVWNYYWKFVQTANNVITVVKPESASEVQLGYLGAGYAFRAHIYLEMSQMFEFLPNDKTDPKTDAGNDVTNLTVPIVREGMTEAAARENPRVDRATMAAFILEDLNNAEKYITNLTIASKTLPHLDVVYGLKARLYMWLGEYAKAKEYARKAITASSVVPMTEDQCLSTTKGFNDISCWMWGSQLVTEDDAVKTGIVNWTSWMSNEAAFGYASVEPNVMLGASLYKRISDTDFRKKLWKAPEGTALAGKTPFLDKDLGEAMATYGSVKFRPADGEINDFNTGAASAFPVMRVEEMYFIEAEAAAHLNEGEGLALITAFMKSYRNSKYATTATGDALIDEIVFQKRIELWGEGLTFFDVKRLNMSVTRGYTGTNFSDARRFNTNGRPAWMNFCIVITEKNNNKALVGFENPNPTDVYTPWK